MSGGFLAVERSGGEVRRRIRRLENARDAAYLRYRESDSPEDKERFMRFAAQVDVLTVHQDMPESMTIRQVSRRVVESYTSRGSAWSLS